MKKIKEKTIDLFNCEKCNTEKSITVIKKITGINTSVEIKKCSNCKHQYYFKDICKMAEHQTPERVIL